jgi:hypothetical protein
MSWGATQEPPLAEASDMNTLFGGDIHAGLSGLELSDGPFDLGEGIWLRQTYAHLFAPFMLAFKPAPPGRHNPGPWKAASGGFSCNVNAELLIPADIEGRFESKIGVARTLVFLLRLGVNPAITLPVFSNYPFSTLPKVPDNHAKLFPFEIQRRYFPLGVVEGRVKAASVEWIKERWQVTHHLLAQSAEFTLAVEALDAGQFLHDQALTIVSLWCGLEALFSPSTSELKFRVSSLISAFLEPPGVNRANRQKEISKLYDKRSAAAHGKPRHEPEHLLQTFNLVREVLIRIIDNGQVPTKDELEGMLFGAS